MKYFLVSVSPTVDKQAIPIFSNAFVLGEIFGDDKQVAQGMFIIGCYIINCSNSLIGYDQNVCGQVARRRDVAMLLE